MGINKDHLKRDIKIYIVLFLFLMALIFIDVLETCPLKTVFGIPCPACGLTRSYLLAFQGKFSEAISMHPFWIPITLLFIVFCIMRYLIVNEEKYEKYIRIVKILTCVLAATMVIFYIYRMIVFFPNREPMVFFKKSVLGWLLQLMK